ncbi:unnamed protein product, partial [Notodromas monacha]
QLSHYLDMVEINIAAQIAQNSEAYFKTMSCHDVLMADLNTTTSKVRVLRAEMSRLRKTLVEGPMQIIALFQQRSRAAVLLKTLKVMRTVHQTQGTVQLLLATSDFVGALDLIATTHDVLEENLKNLRCFRHLGTQLRELEKIIGRVLVTDFYRWVTGFLNRPELPETRSSGEEEDGRDRLSAIVFGLVKLGETKVMLDTLREESGAALKALVKQVLAETLTRSDVVSAAVEDKEDDGASGGVEDGGGKRGVAADISGLDMQAWFAFFKDLCANVVALLKRIKSLNGLIGDMVSTAAEANEAKDDAAKSARVEELMTGLNAAVVWACNMAHERIARVILASGKCLDKCSASDYRALNTCIKEFSLATEHISGKKMSHVWSALHGQTQKFIARFHDSHKAKLGMLLDNERWQAAKVPRELQQLVDNIFTLGKFTASPKQLPEQDAGNPFAELAVATSHLAVEGQQFIVVGVVLMLVRDVGEYCDLARENISLASDLLTRLSDLLGFYNSRMSQLLLGAGALSSAGLRTISAKNLALGWRSLQLVQAMLPRIKAFFEEILLTRASGIRQLDQVTRDVEAHGMGLCSKLSQIVDTGMEMQLARWELKPPVPSLAFKSICLIRVVLMLVRDVGEYCDLARENISLASDLLTRLSDLLGFYNSRMSQLLLGAGALSSAGLRTISAKNLALGWRSLQLVQAMLPRIKAFFEEILLTRASGIRQLDQTILVFEVSAEHSNQFRLVLTYLVARQPRCKLNEAVSDVLPHSQLDAIYSKVHASFRSRIHANIIKSGIKNDGGPDHGLITAELTFYVEQLKSLKCFVDPRKLESFHEEVWKES